MKNDTARIGELTVALEKAERKLAEREALVTAAFKQAEEARAQYEHATERAETLRRRLDAKDEELNALQKDLRQRDELIAELKQVCEENDNALNAINREAARRREADSSPQPGAPGLTLESLDEPGIRHRMAGAVTTLGRASDNDIAINSTSVSRYHARMVVESDGVHLVDLHSTNGCSVNGRTVAVRQQVNDGDVIAIGHAKFKLTAEMPATGAEDRSMDETNALLDHGVVFPASRPRTTASK